MDTVDVTVRSRPKYGTFIFLGVLLGFMVAGILIMLPVDTSQLTQQYSIASTFGVLAAFLGIVGGFLGASVALVLEKIVSKKARTYTVAAEYEPVVKDGGVAGTDHPAETGAVKNRASDVEPDDPSGSQTLPAPKAHKPDSVEE